MVNEQESRRDEELVAFTDALLEGGEIDAQEAPPLADTVELLARVLAPEDPPERLRRRVHRAIVEEWNPPARRFRFFGAFRIRRRPLWAAAVAVLAVLAVTTVLLVAPGTEGVVGAAGGGPWLVPLIVIVTLLAAGIVVWTILRR